MRQSEWVCVKSRVCQGVVRNKLLGGSLSERESVCSKERECVVQRERVCSKECVRVQKVISQ